MKRDSQQKPKRTHLSEFEFGSVRHIIEKAIRVRFASVRLMFFENLIRVRFGLIRILKVDSGSVRFIFEKDRSIQEIMLQVGWIFIPQLLIPVYLITLRLVVCFEALKGLILVFSFTFCRLHLIKIRNEQKLWGSSSVRFDTSSKALTLNIWLTRWYVAIGIATLCDQILGNSFACRFCTRGEKLLLSYCYCY